VSLILSINNLPGNIHFLRFFSEDAVSRNYSRLCKFNRVDDRGRLRATDSSGWFFWERGNNEEELFFHGVLPVRTSASSTLLSITCDLDEIEKQ